MQIIIIASYASYFEKCINASSLFGQMSQAKKQIRKTLTVRDFPVDLRDLLNRIATHLKINRDELIADLLVKTYLANQA